MKISCCPICGFPWSEEVDIEEEQLKNIIPNWDTLRFDWKQVFTEK